MNEEIRILCVFSTLDRGGAETMCMNYYRQMDRDKVQFDFVKHTSAKGAFEDEIESMGGRIYTAPRLRGRNILQYGHWWKQHLTEHPEHLIVHGHYFTVSSFYFKIAHRMGRITVGHSHTSEQKNRRMNAKLLLLKYLLTKTEKESDYCLACSESAGQYLFPNKGYTVIPNAIDVEKYRFDSTVRTDIRNQLGIPEEEKVVCVVGSITAVKNPQGTLTIFDKLHEKIPDARLVWAGNGILKQEIEKRISELGLNDEVFLLGVRDDVNRILQGADVYIMPSFVEGLSVAAIEAQAAGLPCVMSDGITQEADLTGNCVFLPIENTEAWVQEIIADFGKERIDTADMVVRAGYDIHTTAKWLQEFYLKISAEAKQSMC